MADQQLPEIKLDATQLYREEIFTDRKAGTLRRLVPVKSDGSDDASRPTLYSGQTQLLTPAGVLPLAFELEASPHRVTWERVRDEWLNTDQLDRGAGLVGEADCHRQGPLSERRTVQRYEDPAQ